MTMDRHFFKCFALIWGSVGLYIGALYGVAWCLSHHHEDVIIGVFLAIVVALTLYVANECANSKRSRQ